LQRLEAGPVEAAVDRILDPMAEWTTHAAATASVAPAVLHAELWSTAAPIATTVAA